ncbi:MAG: amidase [Deltaproteobacteria bacterium]|nr:amidase [Deltaproteobacteria bacterium]
MSFDKPTRDQIRVVADSLGIDLSDGELDGHLERMEGFSRAYALVDEAPDPAPAVGQRRAPARRPRPAENRYNAWYVKTSIREEYRGRLAGKTLAVKDSICVAGVPMMNGASFLEGHVPDVDATVVTRALHAGVEIVGKTNCEYLSLSGGSHTCANGPVLNPHKEGYSAGGSSSGSAVAVAVGDAGMALGCDQAGSIRVPAAWCGIVGMKPTHGLVPYTGILGVDPVVDHCGPMTRDVDNNALLLEALAGRDGMDPRQPSAWHPVKYTAARRAGAKRLRVAVVKEGFGRRNAEAEVDEQVRAAADTLARAGLEVAEVSVPIHEQAWLLAQPFYVEGLAHSMGQSGVMPDAEGLGPGWAERFATWNKRWRDLPENVSALILFGAFVRARSPGHYYVKAQRLRRTVHRAYDEAFSGYDLLLMPTTPMAATPLPAADAGPAERAQRAGEMLANTGPFNLTGHPAITLPCGATADGRPVGMMLVGRHFDEITVYRAAYAFERTAN